ncbi:MAG: ubiquinone biosynthesis protein [Frankiales bacterium]|nr:ubiquinone biosynthesis protein [Frankiales bacterium]
MIVREMARHPGRYRDIARLLLKYGRSDLVHRAGLESAFLDDPDSAPPDLAADLAKGESLAADLERMGPTFIKLGQLLSTRADLLPQSYIDGLTRLQDRLEPFPFDDARAIIEEELGVRLSRVFDEIDEAPMAAASLGQVHAATLRGGRDVVVKVQRPGIRRQVLDDLEMLEPIAEALERHTDGGQAFGAVDLLARFRRSLVDELDYRKEAANLVRLRGIVANRTRLVVPRPYDDFTSSRVLTMDRVRGRKVTEMTPLARLEIDGAALAHDLFDAYLDQILIEGFFHADPHPGNVLLTPEGRLGLIDLGMVAQVAPQMRDRLTRLLLALGEQRGEEVARMASEMSERLDEYDERRFTAEVSQIVERHGAATLGQLDVGRLVLEITRACGTSGLRPPAELSMVGKALLNLDMVARTLDPDVAPVEIVQARAMELARGGVRPSMSGLLNAAMETRDFVEQLPGRVNRAMDVLASGSFKLEVDAFDEKELLYGLHRMANRIATGLVLAALIVGAALLMNVQTSSRIAGYPALAFVLFMAAAVGGAWLVGSIVLGDRRLRRKR